MFDRSNNNSGEEVRDGVVVNALVADEVHIPLKVAVTDAIKVSPDGIADLTTVVRVVAALLQLGVEVPLATLRHVLDGDTSGEGDLHLEEVLHVVLPSHGDGTVPALVPAQDSHLSVY